MPADPSAAPTRQAPDAIVTPGARALYSVATSFESSSDPQAVLLALLGRVAAAVGARSAWLLAPGDSVAAAWPDRTAPPPEPDPSRVLSLPLMHAGIPTGTLVVADPAAGAFGAGQRHLAVALAHPAAAVAAVALRLAEADARAHRAEEAAALQADLAGAVDHDLRTQLTTVMGALQTLARPEWAPADAELAALLESAVRQARRMGSLLGDLSLTSPSTSRREALPPDALRALLAEAARAGIGGAARVPIEIPAGFPPAAVDPPALRRALDGVLRRACRLGLAARVEVAAWGDDAVIAVCAEGPGPLVPDLTTRLAAAMGARIEESVGADGSTVVQLTLPGALRPGPG